MRGLLVYNPVSGLRHDDRAAVVRQVACVLRGHGYELDVVATTHRGSAGEQAREAVANGANVVFACGGDGTVHDVLQGVAGTSAALAVIPMGSGNALARELRNPLHPIAAARAYRACEVVDVRVGRCSVGDHSRAFLIMAGAGPDGALMYRMLAVNRSRWGRWTYAVHALRMLFRRRFQPFLVRYCVDGVWREARAVSAMAMRAGSLGGVFPGVARGASLSAQTMRLVLVKGPAVVGLPLWFAMNWLGLERWNPLLVSADVTAFMCDGADTHVQVDGEWIGRLPVQVALDDETVRMLVPRQG